MDRNTGSRAETTDMIEADPQPEAADMLILDRFRTLGKNAVRLMVEPVATLLVLKQSRQDRKTYFVEHRDELIVALEAEIQDTRAYLDSGVTADGDILPDFIREQIQAELPICEARLKWLRKMR